MSTFFAITLTLFFVIDALGNIPAFIQLLKPYDRKKRRTIALRELFFALGLMIIFNYLGRVLLTLLSIEAATVQLAGGIVLFLIAIRLIFSTEEEGAKMERAGALYCPYCDPNYCRSLSSLGDYDLCSRRDHHHHYAGIHFSRLAFIEYPLPLWKAHL